jgi:dTDP-4-dehydrorhamnose 3,5-epimerase
MTDSWQRTQIPGVLHRRNREFVDERGSFMELWRASHTEGIDGEQFVQANLSRSRANVLRGMHFHLRQADLWILIDGRAVAATTDLRDALHGGEPRSQLIEIEPGDALYIPRRVAHGFLAMSDMLLVYLVSAEYDGSDEHGFAWNDSQAGIEWPHKPAVISGRDQANPPLADILERLRQDSR